jgi:colicin import membrane protein
LQDFDAPPPPTTSVQVVVERDDPVKQRTVQVAVELGDNLFRRGKYKEAHTQFELALSLSPHHQELSLRIESCKPHLPPPPPPPAVVVVQPAPPPVVIVPVARPRIAVMNFVVNADPGLVPPAFGDWASEQVASYFTPTYEVVERGEVCWYMGRLGITMRDVLMNPSARVCLGRALNVRLFVFGAIQQTASFNVSTHLIDAESGVKQGGGQIHVQDHQELKLRAGELVQQTQANPAEAKRLQQESRDQEKILNDARKLFQAGQYQQTVNVCQQGLQRFPNHAGLQTLKQQAEQKIQQAGLEEKRKQELAAQQAQAVAMQKRQQQLALETEAARKRAEQVAAARSDAERQAQEAQRQKAYDDLHTGGLRALQQGNYPQAIQMLQSAVALKPNPVAQGELDQARKKADEVARAKAAADKARQDAALKQQKEAELARVRAQVEADRKKREAEDLARRRAQEARDQAVNMHKAQAAAAQKAAEQAEAKRKADTFQKWMTDGRQALAGKRYDAAIQAFHEAQKLQPADPSVAAALKEAEAARQAAGAAQAAAAQQAAAQAEAARKKQADDQRAAQVNQLLTAGRNALNARQFDAAAKAFTDASKLAPTNPAVVKALQDLDQARRAATAADAEQKKRQMEAELRKRQADYQAAMNAGRQALAAKRFDDAVRSFTDASRLQPGDPAAAAMLKEVDKARKADYARLMAQGKAAMTAKHYEDAVKAFTDALKAQPGDAAATGALKEANQALQGSKSPPKK